MDTASLLYFLLTAIKWLIIIDAVLSWVMPEDRFPRSLTGQITDPLYAPIRALLPPDKTGGFDLSPLIVLMLVYAMESMLHRVI
jgi:YggT family protein